MANDFAKISFTLDISDVESKAGKLQSIIDKYNGKEFPIKFKVEMSGAEQDLGKLERSLSNIQQLSSRVTTSMHQMQGATGAAGKSQTVSMQKSQQQMAALLRTVQTQINQSSLKTGKMIDSRELDKAKEDLLELGKLYEQFETLDLSQYGKGGKFQFTEEQLSQFNQLTHALEKYRLSLREADVASREAGAEISSSLSFRKLENRMMEFWNNYGSSVQRSAKHTKEFERQLQAVQSGTGDIAKMTDSFIKYENQMHELGMTEPSILQRLQSGFSGKLFYMTMAQAAMYTRQAVRQMFVNTKDIDSAMTQLQIVTKGSDADMSQYFETASESAQKLGVSIVDLTNSATTFSRLGYSAEESEQLAEYTAMLTKVGDIDTQTVTNAVTAIVKAFDMDVDDVQGVMDKMVEVGNNFPISVSDLAEGMNNTGSALHAAGNDFDQSVALLTAANTTVNLCRSA